MYVTVQLQGWAYFPNTVDSIASDVSEQLQAAGLSVQAFSVTHADRWTQITELQFLRFTYAATVQISGQDLDADSVTSAVTNAFALVTGNTPSAVKVTPSETDPGGAPSVPTGGWDVLSGLHTDARVLTIGLLAVVALAVVVIGKNVRIAA